VSASPFAPLALLLALAACAASPPPLPVVPVEPEPPGVVACRDEARRDAATRESFRQFNPANPANQARIASERREVEEQAFRDCLRRNGIAGGGGVERVQPRR
jgi:hypothetical protein